MNVYFSFENVDQKLKNKQEKKCARYLFYHIQCLKTFLVQSKDQWIEITDKIQMSLDLHDFGHRDFEDFYGESCDFTWLDKDKCYQFPVGIENSEKKIKFNARNSKEKILVGEFDASLENLDPFESKYVNFDIAFLQSSCTEFNSTSKLTRKKFNTLFY